MSDQYVRVPRELLEASVSIPRNNAEFQSQVAVIEKIRALLAASTEDVRAVVEEPVAWEMDDSAGESGLILVTNDKSLRDEWVRDELPVCPLFSQSHRPVVLPERVEVPGNHAGLSRRYAQGWNACLDAVEELNK